MPLPPRRGKPLELQVHRQILWVGSAAAPLRNVSWVEVFRLKPAWGKAGVYFLLLVIFAFLVSARLDSTDGGSGPAPGILTLPTMDELRAIAGQIVYAIDHPEYEFSAVLEQYNTTNNFGSVVNMNGGRGNTGINHGTVVHNDSTAQDTELQAAVTDLIRLLNDLRPELTPDQAQTVENALPALTPDRAALRERGMILASVSQIAATVGEMGRPVVEALGRLLALLG
ncbi:DUF6232 family protein [Streptomyces fungicidicus]|uniref:DUF6232 family protein n=1 Tax=Streptomyces fungicidicus TaxID=68203 RepID=UPI0036777554